MTFFIITAIIIMIIIIMDNLSDLGRRITQSTDDHSESTFLFKFNAIMWSLSYNH